MLVLFAALFAAIVYRWISLEQWQRATATEIPGTPTPAPTPTRPPVISGKLDTAKLFNGITLHSSVETIPGAVSRGTPVSPDLEKKIQNATQKANEMVRADKGGEAVAQ